MERRDQIANCAIRLISERGIRALTHRAVDRELQLPAGSTSYYVRTRRDLLMSVVDEVTERSRRNFAALPTQGESLDQVADTVAHYLDQLVYERRHDVVARFALTIEAADDSELRDRLARCFFSPTLAAGLFDSLGEPGAADGFVALLEGLLYDAAVNGRRYSVRAPILGYLRGTCE